VLPSLPRAAAMSLSPRLAVSLRSSRPEAFLCYSLRAAGRMRSSRGRPSEPSVSGKTAEGFCYLRLV
jgi:hypothetical protein